MGLGMKRSAVLLLALILASCGNRDEFAPGTWAIEGWLESGGVSGQGKPSEHQTHTVKLSQQSASRRPVEVFFTEFYGRENIANISFKDGRIAGSFEQGRVDDISGHNVPISGTYSRDKFDVTFRYKAFGQEIRQIVRGKLVSPSG